MSGPLRDRDCEVCKKEPAKYRCPRCELVTCSLPCSIEHKRQTNCDGKRQRSTFASDTSDLTEPVLWRDYCFLQEASRLVGATSDSSRAIQRKKKPLLARAATKQGIDLQLSPVGMSRQRQNTSFFDVKKKEFRWRIEWVFVGADIKLTRDRQSGSTCPRVLLEELMASRPGNIAIRESLRRYVNALHSGKARVAIEDFKAPASNRGFIDVDITKPLTEALVGKRILDFPTLHVFINGDAENADHQEEPKQEQYQEHVADDVADTDSTHAGSAAQGQHGQSKSAYRPSDQAQAGDSGSQHQKNTDHLCSDEGGEPKASLNHDPCPPSKRAKYVTSSPQDQHFQRQDPDSPRSSLAGETDNQ